MANMMKSTAVIADKTILANGEFLARPYTIKASAIAADSNGKKIVKGGTPFPANDATAIGLLLDTVDVTDGDKTVALVYAGTVSTAKLAANGVTVQTAAKTALPRITFFE